MKNKKLRKASGGLGEASITNSEYQAENLDILDPNNSNNTTKNTVGIGKNVNANLLAIDNSTSTASTTKNLKENYDEHKTTIKFLNFG